MTKLEELIAKQHKVYVEITKYGAQGWLKRVQVVAVDVLQLADGDEAKAIAILTSAQALIRSTK